VLNNRRLLFSFLIFVSIFCVLIGRLGYLSLGFVSKKGIELPLENISRLDIVDRRGMLLATSIPTFSVYMKPLDISNKADTIAVLGRIFPELSKEKITQLVGSQKKFLWFLRHISPEKKWMLEKEGLTGVVAIPDNKRIYPYGRLFSHVVGFTDIDQNGLAGLEKSQNTVLLDKEKKSFKTSLDLGIQHVLHSELSARVAEVSAKGGFGMLVHLSTGRILSMVSLPDFDPNHIRESCSISCDGLDASGEIHPMFNRITTGVYEFGSVIKIHTVAAGLIHHIPLSRSYDARHPIRVGRFLIKDFCAKNRILTVKEGFLYSSNIVNAKLAFDVGPQRLKAFWDLMGVNQPIALELPERTHSIVPKEWNNVSILSLGFGYGMAMTPLHLAYSIMLLVDGHKKPLTLAGKSGSYRAISPRVIPESVCRQIAQLMRSAVLEGQAARAKVDQMDIGAKTGTANCRVQGHYKDKLNLTTCAAIFPTKNPEYLLLLSLDRPVASTATNGFASAGWMVAPLVARVAKRLLPFLDFAGLENPKEKSTINDDQENSYLFVPQETRKSS
jgi:cell division protein FtsI (penicillin-binding protein 3)